MANAKVFDLESYLDRYAPKSLSDGQWWAVRTVALDLTREVGPVNESDAKNLLGALTRFLARMCPVGDPQLSALTSEGLDSFIALERVAGAEDSTLGQVSRHLRRLLGALLGSPARKPGRAKTAAPPPFDPVGEVEWLLLLEYAADLESAGDTNLKSFLAAGARSGFDAQALSLEGWGSTEVAALREQLRVCSGTTLELHRLRHRWLRGVLSDPAPLSELVSRHGLTRRDLERAVRALDVREDSQAALRSA